MKQEWDIRMWWTDSLRLNFPSGTFGPIVPTYTTPAYGSSNSSSKFSRLDYEDIGGVHKHRYLCQLIALEIFSTRSCLV
jgi:hypothetical protein